MKINKVLICILLIVITSLYGCNIYKEKSCEDAPIGLSEKEGVWLVSEYDIYDKDTQIIKVKWSNEIQGEIMFGEHFRLEKYVDDKWKIVRNETEDQIVFIDIGYILKQDETAWKEYDLTLFTDGLTAGEYRISTRYHIDSINGVKYPAGDHPEYQTYAYFSVE